MNKSPIFESITAAIASNFISSRTLFHLTRSVHSLYTMVSRSISLLAALAITGSAATWSNSTMTTTAEVIVYTTVCPATSFITSGTKTFTSVYTTTSTITSCKAGCPTASAKPDCDKDRSDCQTKPDANQAVCAALYAQCAGTISGLNKNTTQTTQDITVYTTVCPATATITSDQKTYTSVYITTSTITSCKGGCPSIAALQTPSSSVATYPIQSTQPAIVTPSVSGSTKPAESAPVQSTLATPADTTPVAGSTNPVGSVPAQSTLVTSAATTPVAGSTQPAASASITTTPVAASSKTTDSTPSATTSSVEFTGAASSFKVGYAGLAGFAMVFLI